MKTLKFVSLIALLLTFMVVVRCSETKTTAPTPLATLSGTVTYSNAGGTSVAAPGAFVTLLSGTSQVIQVVTDNTGKYSIPSLAAGAYVLTASFYAEPTNTGGRLSGLNFEPAADVPVTMGTVALTTDLTLVNAGQAGADLDPVNINFDWNGTAYANHGLTGNYPALPATFPAGQHYYDQTHSPVNFEFAYRGKEADFNGTFKQLKKVNIQFDAANPTAGTIDVIIDLASFDTRSPGGRDARTAVADGPPFNPTTLFTEYGCMIYNVFGVITDSGTAPSDATSQVITNDSRYVQFTSTSIAKLGDGYVAKGNIVFKGPRAGMTPAIITSVPIEMWFKQVPCWTDASQTPPRRYWSFEGKFLMDAKAKWNITSSSLNEAIVRMQISIVAYRSAS